MRKRIHNWTRTAAFAALCALLWNGAAQMARAQAAEKKYKDTAEYDIYNEVIKDVTAKNFSKAITDLDTWKQKYPESDFKDDRSILYMQAYTELKQFNKALDIAAELMTKDLDATFPDPKTGPGNVLKVLFTASQAVQLIESPTPQQLATGEKAARKLLDYNRKAEGTSDADWANARTQLQTFAKAALLSIAVRPGNAALTAGLAKNPPSLPDCQAAETAFSKALQDYPDKSFISYNLGRALNCIARANPSQATEVAPKAIYEFVRAATVDPTLGGSADGKKISEYADNAYVTYHGSAEGLDQLKQQAKASPLPPAGFTIETASAAAAKKENEFKEKYPQLAMWLGIKRQLADAATGNQYFEGQLKNAAVPKLKGNVVEGKPACRSKELLVSVPLPDQPGGARAEITLKLDAPLTGKPEPGEIQWEGVPSAFTADPFMLTMDTEKSKIEGLKTSACAGSPAGGSKKGATTKKGGKKK